MNWIEKSNATKDQLRRLNKAIPEATSAFSALGAAVKKDSAIDFKTKEFVALGIAVALRCEACIVLHMEALHRCGATRAEVGDVLAMCLQMGGGPSMMYAAKAMECFDQMAPEQP